ncbi:MAG: hypothetical protein ACTSRZ_19825 [Promethearchaeota archaeon]
MGRKENNDENFQTLSPGKAIFGFIADMVIFVVAPFILRDYLNTNYPTYAAYFTDDIFNMIITLGVFSAITVFFKNLWKSGTRPHGFFNIIFAVFHAYYVIAIFGGLNAFLDNTGTFGIFVITVMNYTISINLAILAYIFLIQTLIAVIVYFFEMIL